jgi:hypothetical protein
MSNGRPAPHRRPVPREVAVALAAGPGHAVAVYVPAAGGQLITIVTDDVGDDDPQDVWSALVKFFEGENLL